MSILCELGLGVGFYTQTQTHTQILKKTHTHIQNPYQILKKIKSLYYFSIFFFFFSHFFLFFSYLVWVLDMGHLDPNG
jgi:hypothetical protein